MKTKRGDVLEWELTGDAEDSQVVSEESESTVGYQDVFNVETGWFFFSLTALDFESGRGEGCSLPDMNLTADLEYIHTTSKLECATSRDDSDSIGGIPHCSSRLNPIIAEIEKKSLRPTSRWSVLES